ncbi:MAG: hypothetical protein F6J92_33300 [Symploca sp. SIO1A3]|nr:hypothetical protein [Symploca sp. SIO1A3]
MPKSFKVVASAIALTMLMVSLLLVNPAPAQAGTKPCGETFNLTETDPVCIKYSDSSSPIELRISCDVEPQTMIWFPGGSECFNVLHDFTCDPQHGSYDVECYPSADRDNFPVRTTESDDGSIRIDFVNG